MNGRIAAISERDRQIESYRGEGRDSSSWMNDDGHECRDAEAAVLEALAGRTESSPTTVFVLGAPRTGSTVLYQSVCRRFGLPYIANLTNDQFAKTPILGLCVQSAVRIEVGFDSRYGKTQGPLQPSEGSGVMSRWFGGGHPSEVVSARILDGAEAHFVSTLTAAEVLFGAPLVIKNAWHCFRVPYLMEALPLARFVWIKRDIAAAAKSDLAARLATKGSATTWNSATPANVEELRRSPPTTQVVENQHAFNKAIGTALQRNAIDRSCTLWYEEFCSDPDGALSKLGAFLGRTPVNDDVTAQINIGSAWRLQHEDEREIDRYVSEHVARLMGDRYPAAE